MVAADSADECESTKPRVNDKRGLGRLWVKRRRTHYEQMFSAVHPITDLGTAEGTVIRRSILGAECDCTAGNRPAPLRLPHSISNASLSLSSTTIAVGLTLRESDSSPTLRGPVYHWRVGCGGGEYVSLKPLHPRLLRGLSLQPLDRDQRRAMARSRPAV